MSPDRDPGDVMLDDLLTPTIDLVTSVDLMSSDGCWRVPAGRICARKHRAADWVRVWPHDGRPQDGITVSMEKLAASLDRKEATVVS